MSARSQLYPSGAALALILAPHAGDAAEPIKLSLGGYAVTGLTVRSQDNVATSGVAPVNRGPGDDRNYSVANTTNAAGATVGVPTTTDLGRTDQFWEAEVWFVGETTLDNGIKVGLNIQLEAYTTSDQVDEHFVYVQGGFGRLVVGAENAAPYIMHYKAPSPSRGEFAPDDNRDFFPFRPPSNNAIASVVTFTTLTSDANKVTYYTPRFAPGFMFGLSYTPDDEAGAAATGCRGGCAFGAGAGISDNKQTNYHHFVEGAVNFVRSINGVDLAFDIGVGYGFLERQSRSAAPGLDRLGKDRLVVTAGYNVAYAGWTIGGAFSWDNKGLQGPNDRYDMTFGVTYGTGPWLVGANVGYALAQDGQARQTGGNGAPVLVRRSNDSHLTGEVGASYQLGPGIYVFSVVNFAEWWGNNTATEESSGVAWSTGVILSF